MKSLVTTKLHSVVSRLLSTFFGGAEASDLDHHLSLEEMESSRSAVLSLYRLLLRKGRELKYTDKQFYKQRIRKEFDINHNVNTEKELNKCIEKGHVFLKKNIMI